jgi:tRNA 5-methylaminomethyl-2-thiouridine biosynthesis bifunctional protein
MSTSILMPAPTNLSEPNFDPGTIRSLNRSDRTVLVIGGGIAGSTAAAILAQAGWVVTLIEPAATHAQHVAAALTPVISSDDNARSRLSRLGAMLADQYWRGLPAQIGTPCGALQLQRPPGAKRVQDLHAQVQTLNKPDWARAVDRNQASELAGLELPRGGIWYPGGWLIRVGQLIEVLQRVPGVQCVEAAVAQMRQVADQWQALDGTGEVIAQSGVAVLANAFDVVGLLRRSALESVLGQCKRLPALHRLAGEVTLLPSALLAGGPRCIVGGDGYVLPAVDGWCVSGGTYVRDALMAQCSAAGRQANLERAQALLGLSFTQASGLPQPLELPGWAGWRAVLPGRLPAIGKLPGVRDLWVFTAGASRGLTWSVLGATLIRDALADRLSSIEPDLQQLIAP